MITLLVLINLIFWAAAAIDFLAGTLSIPILDKNSARTAAGFPFPKVSIIFAARNEEKNIREALVSMLAQSYPDFEVIAVNDRSEDKTGEFLESFRSSDKLKIIRIDELPEGWLGKNHALYQGYLKSDGDWLLFTDADVIFDTEALRCAVRTVIEKKKDHLVLIPKMITRQWIERVFVNYFVLAFNRRFRPWAASDPKSSAFVGIGAFNFLKRRVYEAIGTHKHLALKVLDDMELGKAVKVCGFHQYLMTGQKLVSVPWVEGFRGVFRSIDKNAFAGLNFNVFTLIAITAAAFTFDILPFALIFLAKGALFPLCLLTLALIASLYGVGQKYDRSFFITFPVHPAASLLFLVILWRSAILVTLRGGIRWRDTFYPTKVLKQTS